MNAMILLAQGAMNMADSLATANPVLTEVNAPEMNMLDMAIKGGWIMIVLGVLSVVCFYILFERNYMIRKAGKEDPMFMERIKDYIHSGEIKAAINYCRTINTPSARMIEKGISRLGEYHNISRAAIRNGSLQRNGIYNSSVEHGNPVYISNRTYKRETAGCTDNINHPATVFFLFEIVGFSRDAIRSHHHKTFR